MLGALALTECHHGRLGPYVRRINAHTLPTAACDRRRRPTGAILGVCAPEITRAGTQSLDYRIPRLSPTQNYLKLVFEGADRERGSRKADL
jgi:hypothetical protein